MLKVFQSMAARPLVWLISRRAPLEEMVALPPTTVPPVGNSVLPGAASATSLARIIPRTAATGQWSSRPDLFCLRGNLPIFCALIRPRQDIVMIYLIWGLYPIWLRLVPFWQINLTVFLQPHSRRIESLSQAEPAKAPRLGPASTHRAAAPAESASQSSKQKKSPPPMKAEG